MENTNNITNANEAVNTQAQEQTNQATDTQSAAPAPEKKELWIVSTAKKVHASKPAKVVRKVALFGAGVGAGIVGTMLVTSKKDSDQAGSEESVEVTEESAQ